MSAAWLPYLPYLIAITYIPGLALVLAARPRTRPLLALAQAPAWTLGVVALMSLIQPSLRFHWGLWSFLCGMVIFIAIAWVIGRITGSFTRWRADFTKTWSRIYDYQMIGLVFVVWAIAIIPIFVGSDPTAPVQGGDSNYHYNQLWLMKQTGDAFPLTSNATMAGIDPDPWYYPNAWHALISLVTAKPSEALLVINSTLLLNPLIFLFSVAGLSIVLSRNERIYPWALLAAGFAPLALTRLQLATTLWPFVFAFAVLPGFLTLILDYVSRHLELPDLSRPNALTRHDVVFIARHLLGLLCLLAVPLIGLFAAHPSVLMPLLVPLFAAIVGTLLIWAFKALKARYFSRGLLFFFTAILLLGCAYYFTIMPGPQRYYFRRFPKVEWDHITRKLFVSTAMFMPGGGAYALLFYFSVCVLTAAALVILWRRKQYAWVFAWISQWLIVIGSYLPIRGISQLTALYYNNPNRAEFAAAIFVVPAIAILFSEVFSTITRHLRFSPRRLAVAPSVICSFLMVLIMIYGAKGVFRDVKTSFYPDTDNVRFLADERELAMIREAGSVLPDDAIVLGDPAAGAALLQPVSGVKVVWTYPNYPTDGPDRYLLILFKSIHRNQHICKILNKHGIEYFYADEPRYYNGGETDELRPGLYGVDLSEGFTKILDGGTAGIYHIDLCQKYK